MSEPRDYSDFLNDIKTEIANLENFTMGMTFESFQKDLKTTYAVVRSIEVIGEAVKNIPRDIKDKNPEIPWKDIAGTRDVLIHGYFVVDQKIIWEVIEKDLPKLKEHITHLK